jgi:hypothetical protein
MGKKIADEFNTYHKNYPTNYYRASLAWEHEVYSAVSY